MRVKLCARCPYLPRDLGGHYDPKGALHACAKCDSQQRAGTSQYPRKAHRRQKCTTVPSIFLTAQPSVARSVTDSLVSSGIIAGEPPSVRSGARIASRSAGRATAVGYAGFTRPDIGFSERPSDVLRHSEVRSKEDAQ
jgi:hypothetical protein